jgi:hypothetical protein
MHRPHRTFVASRVCRARFGIAPAAVLLLAMSACAGGAGSSAVDTSTGGAPEATGGTAGSRSGISSAGATGSDGGSSGTGGLGTATGGGAGGTASPGTGGTGLPAGTGGSTSSGMGGGLGGSRTEGTGGDGSGGTTGTGGAAQGGSGGTSPGSAGAVGAGGSGGKPNQSALPAITIHLAGDSTMSDYTAATTQEGWGQELGQFFISKVTIDNQAQPGANIQTFYSGRWKTLINNVKAGDYVMAAFGINDSGTTHGPVTPAAFETQMGVMANEVAAKKATFVPTTSSPLQVWVNGKETNARLQPYCDATIALGMSKGLLVDDLNARGVEYYNMIGQTAAAALTFNGDKAHFDKQGATEIALLASQELARIDSPLAAYLK